MQPKYVNLTELGIQLQAPSKRSRHTVRAYDAPLDDAMLARVKARVAAQRGFRPGDR